MKLHVVDARMRFTWAVAMSLAGSFRELILTIYAPRCDGIMGEFRAIRKAITTFHKEVVTVVAVAQLRWEEIAADLRSRDPEVPGSRFLSLLRESEDANWSAYDVEYGEEGIPFFVRPVVYDFRQRLMKIAMDETMRHHQRLVVAQRLGISLA
ncbi:MAG: hypothetical protein AB1768_17780 [Pseudomonadota bacterium]|jgi:hypothetical protein